MKIKAKLTKKQIIRWIKKNKIIILSIITGGTLSVTIAIILYKIINNDPVTPKEAEKIADVINAGTVNLSPKETTVLIKDINARASELSPKETTVLIKDIKSETPSSSVIYKIRQSNINFPPELSHISKIITDSEIININDENAIKKLLTNIESAKGVKKHSLSKKSLRQSVFPYNSGRTKQASTPSPIKILHNNNGYSPIKIVPFLSKNKSPVETPILSALDKYIIKAPDTSPIRISLLTQKVDNNPDKPGTFTERQQMRLKNNSNTDYSGVKKLSTPTSPPISLKSKNSSASMTDAFAELDKIVKNTLLRSSPVEDSSFTERQTSNFMPNYYRKNHPLPESKSSSKNSKSSSKNSKPSSKNSKPSSKNSNPSSKNSNSSSKNSNSSSKNGYEYKLYDSDSSFNSDDHTSEFL